MPKYAVLTPENTYALWSTVVDSFTGEVYTQHELYLNGVGSNFFQNPDRDWTSCIAWMREFPENHERILDGILKDAAVRETWKKIILGTDPIPDFPTLPQKGYQPPPRDSVRVLCLIPHKDFDKVVGDLRASEAYLNLPVLIDFVRPPARADEFTESEGWEREVMVLMEFVDAVYCPHEFRYRDLIKYTLNTRLKAVGGYRETLDKFVQRLRTDLYPRLGSLT